MLCIVRQRRHHCAASRRHLDLNYPRQKSHRAQHQPQTSTAAAMPRKKQKEFEQYEEVEVKKEPSSSSSFSSSPSSDLEAESQARCSVPHSEMRTIDGQISRLKADISYLQTEPARLNGQSLAFTLSQEQQHVDRVQQQLRGQDVGERECVVAFRDGGGEGGGAAAAAGRSRVIAKAKGGILTNRWFKRPRSFAFDDEGNLVVSDNCNHRIQVLRYRDGLYLRTIGSCGSGDGQFKWPQGIAFDRLGSSCCSRLGQSSRASARVQ